VSGRGLSDRSIVLGRTARAAVGGLLVTGALIGVSQAYAHADRPPTTGYAVATEAVAPGDVLRPASFELLPVDLPHVLAGRAFSSVDVLDGAVALAPLEPGELVQLSQVLPSEMTPPTGVDLSFALPSERALAGDLRPGERVDLVASFQADDTRVVAQRALVTRATSSDSALLEADGGLVVTVRLQSQDEVLGVVEAVDEGQLTVVRPTAGGAP
jgi:hypothetical protein